MDDSQRHSNSSELIKFKRSYKEKMTVSSISSLSSTKSIDHEINTMECQKILGTQQQKEKQDVDTNHSSSSLSTKKDSNATTHEVTTIATSNKKRSTIDFVQLLPREVLYGLFCYYNLEFIDFVTCIHVCNLWHLILMVDIWPSLSTTKFFSTYPLSRLTSKEQQLVKTGLLSIVNSNYQFKQQRSKFSILANTYERTQAVIDMGNCGLETVGKLLD